MRSIRGVVIASWKLYPIPRAVAWNMAASAIFACSYGSCSKNTKNEKITLSLYTFSGVPHFIARKDRTYRLRQHFVQNIVLFTFDKKSFICIVRLWDMQLIYSTWQENLIVLSLTCMRVWHLQMYPVFDLFEKFRGKSFMLNDLKCSSFVHLIDRGKHRINTSV